MAEGLTTWPLGLDRLELRSAAYELCDLGHFPQLKLQFLSL